MVSDANCVRHLFHFWESSSRNPAFYLFFLFYKKLIVNILGYRSPWHFYS